MTCSVRIAFVVVIFFSEKPAGASPVYNTWYEKDGVLYDITQTADSKPVLLSIASAGAGAGGMTISYESMTPCRAGPRHNPLKIDTRFVPSTLSCIPAGNAYIVTYTVTDSSIVNDVLKKLRADFTVVLMDDIKIWSANINKPLYGAGGWYQ